MGAFCLVNTMKCRPLGSVNSDTRFSSFDSTSATALGAPVQQAKELRQVVEGVFAQAWRAEPASCKAPEATSG